MRRIGLSLRVEDLADRGERRDCIDQQWVVLLAELGLLPILLPNAHPEPDAMLRALQLDGLILTGGNDLAHLDGATNTATERDAFERRALAFAAGRRLPLLGVCRGMQHLVHHWGGALSAVSGHVRTSHALRWLHGHAADAAVAFPAMTDGALVNSFHDFGVAADDVGDALVPVALSQTDGSVEAVAHRDLPQWGIMWHPERGARDALDATLIRTLFSTTRSTP